MFDYLYFVYSLKLPLEIKFLSHISKWLEKTNDNSFHIDIRQYYDTYIERQ